MYPNRLFFEEEHRMKCSTCGGVRESNILRHKPTCPSYLTSLFFGEHPDVYSMEVHWYRYYPDDVWPGPAPMQPPKERQMRWPARGSKPPATAQKPPPPASPLAP